jgi:glycosyltransferase involved in cell wall biosynthesis
VFFGSLPHDEVFDWLDTIDIYVQPSKQEGLPRAQIEAMSRGVPSFGSKAGGIPELLDREFIFNTVKEICDILLSLDTDTMIEQAKRNFSESKKYDKASIERHRQLFFKDFYQSAHQLRNATDSLSPVETA